MTIADLSLVKKVPITVYRHAEGSYVEGEWVEGGETSFVIKGNAHPFSDYQVMLLPESDRSRSWLWLFTTSKVRAKREGSGGWGADRFIWDGEMYEVMQTQTFTMQVRDHVEAKCVRVELSPN
jgi:hypothetical protein